MSENADTSGEIVIEGLQVDALIGVYPHERETPQPLLIDIALGYRLSKAANSDELADTIDYAEVVAWVRKFVPTRADLLLERLAQEVVDGLCEAFRPLRIRLHMRKPHAARALGCEGVGVLLLRDCA